MRILQVTPYFSPQMGGVPEVAYQISKHLAQQGHAVTVATTDYARQNVRFDAEGVDVVEIPNWVAGFGFYLNPGLIGWARQHLASFDVIHLHTVRTFQNAVVAHFARQSGIPYLLSAHGTLPVIIERKLPKRVFDLLAGRKILKYAAGFHAVSEVEVEQFQMFGLAAEKIHLIYNGLDLDAFQHLPEPGLFRRKLSIPAGTKIILHLSRIHKIKRIDQVIRAYKRIVEDLPASMLLIAGPDEGEQVVLEKLVRSLGLEQQVIFTGPVYGRDKLALLQDADLVISTGMYEIFGMVPFEALMCGTPVVVSDNSGAGRLVGQAEMGWLVKSGDANDLAEKMRAALADPETGQTMVRRGQAFIRQQLGWTKITEKLEGLYQKLIDAQHKHNS